MTDLARAQVSNILEPHLQVSDPCSLNSFKIKLFKIDIHHNLLGYHYKFYTDNVNHQLYSFPFSY